MKPAPFTYHRPTELAEALALLAELTDAGDHPKVLAGGQNNHAEHLPARRQMMQAWADFLDELRTGAEVRPLRAA